MKALDTTNPSYGKDELLMRKELFQKLDTLRRKQQIICPYSDIHERESAVFSGYASLKKMYTYLGGGMDFHGETIKTFQIQRHFSDRLAKAEHRPVIDLYDAFGEDPRDQRDGHLYVSFDRSYVASEIDAIQKENEEVSTDIANIFENQWKESSGTFEQQHIAEVLGFGKGMLKGFIESMAVFVAYENGHADIERLFGKFDSFPSMIGSSLLISMERAGITDPQKRHKLLTEYYTSESLIGIPYVNLTAMLWANNAVRAANGADQNPPNRGESNDISVISTYMPYCDAMLLDHKMYTKITQNPLKERIEKLPYPTKFFSNSPKEIHKFIAYLEDLESNITPEVNEGIKGLYGDVESLNDLYK